MRQFVSGKFENRYKATIGADFFTHEETIDGRQVGLQIWDTAGQERFQSLGSAFYRGADACMIIFDITSSDTFSHISSWLQEFVLQAGKKQMILVGNKADLQDRRQVFNRGIQQWCAEHPNSDGSPMAYIETSAKNNLAVAEAFRNVAAAAYREKQATIDDVPIVPGSVKSLKKPEQKRKESPRKCSC
jgi:Ras-related protein Rab-7A